MRKRRTPSTDCIADMLAFYKQASDQQDAASRDEVVFDRARASFTGSNHRRAALGALVRIRRHRRRHCAGAA